MPKIQEKNNNTQAYWDGVHQRGEYPTLDPNNMQRYKVAAQYQMGNTALDIGCGQAGLGLVLLEQYPEVHYTGVDFSREGLNTHILPGEWGQRYSFVKADWRRGLNGIEPSNTVYLLEVLEHCKEPDKLLATAARLAKVHMVIGVPQYQMLTEKQRRGEHLWDFTEEELIELLIPYGRVCKPIPANSLCWVLCVDVRQQ